MGKQIKFTLWKKSLMPAMSGTADSWFTSNACKFLWNQKGLEKQTNPSLFLDGNLNFHKHYKSDFGYMIYKYPFKKVYCCHCRFITQTITFSFTWY